MRTWTRWAAVAVVAAGCGGSRWGSDAASAGDGRTDEPVDERTGPASVCAACKVTGGGQIQIGGSRVELSVLAIHEPGAEPEGGAVAASGRVQLHEVECGEKLDRRVDTILGCRRENGELIATFTGPGGFEITVVDGGEPANDLISFQGLFSNRQGSLASGNLQVHDLEQCEPDGEGGTAPEGGTGDGTVPGDGTEGGGGTGGDGTGGTAPDDGTGGTPPDPFIPL